MTKNRFKRGFVVKRKKDSKFLRKNGEWAETTVFEAFMFLGDRVDIEGFIKVNNLSDDCEFYSFSFTKVGGKRVAGNRFKRIEPFSFRTLDWPEGGRIIDAEWAKE